MDPLLLAASCPPSAGSRDASFAEVYREHFAKLVLLCRRYLSPQHDAEAVAQEAFIRAWESWDRYSAGRPFWPWVATIARRLCLNEIRAAARRETLHERAAAVSTAVGPSAEEDLEACFEAHSLRRVFARLSPRQQRLLRLRDIEGWSYEEIARFDGVTVEAVRGSLKRARASFRRVYEVPVGGAFGGLVAALRRVVHRSERIGTGLLSPLFGHEPLVVAVVAGLVLAPSAVAVRPQPPAPVVATAAIVTTTSTSTFPTDGPPLRRTSNGAAGTDVALPTTTSSSVPAASTPSSVDDAPFTSTYELQFTASPSYADDRTVFAAGRERDCSSQISGCLTLSKSTDGGVTWTRLPAEGFPGGPVLLPPAYPRDPRIFAGSLFVSEDGGATFRRLLATAGQATMSPLFSDGDPRILIGAMDIAPVLATQYDAEKNETQPLALPLPVGTMAREFVFSPNFVVDRLFLVSAVRPAARGLGKIAVVYLCEPDRCQPVLDHMGPVPLRLAWTDGPGGMALAWLGGSVYRSLDGRNFEQLDRLPSGPDELPPVLSSVVPLPDGRILASGFFGNFDRSRVYEWDGASWAWRVREHPELFATLTRLPDGTLLAGPSRVSDNGLRCSVDIGRTWHRACPASAR
ncbi:MAG: sigma-70 family RNA polymerase sigma factor [Actinomycetota bacterium]|nr:sigma-70 family RNA polymerase sigma factor [Actinomycetota bacterium]